MNKAQIEHLQERWNDGWSGGEMIMKLKLIEIVCPGHFMDETMQRKYSSLFPTYASRKPYLAYKARMEKAKQERSKARSRQTLQETKDKKAKEEC